MAEPVTIFTPSATPASNPAPAMPVQRETHVRDARQVAGTRSDPDVTPARALWQRDFDTLTKENPFRDPNVVISKAQDGTLQVRPRGDAQPAVPGAAPGAGEQPQPQPDHGPASTDGTTLRVGEVELDEAAIRGLLERKSYEDGRRATMPTDPSGYALDLPQDFVLPPGIDGWKFDTDNPVSAALLSQAQHFAFTAGLDGPAFSRMLGLFASHQLAEEGRFNDLKKAEIAKLGTNVSTRVDAATTWLDSQLPADLSGAIRKSLHTAKSIEAIERLMRNFSSQGVSGNPSAARDGGHREQRLSEAEYSKLTYAQKTEYAQRFDQSQFNGR